MSAPIIVERDSSPAVVRTARVLAEALGHELIHVPDVRAAAQALRRDEQAALAVIAARGRGRIAAGLTSARAAALSAALSRPVLVVPEGAGVPRPGSGSIVVGVDGSAESIKALALAQGLAGPLDLTPVPVFADQERPRPGGVGGVVVRPAGARKALNAVVAQRDGQIAVVGARGRGAIASALLGSVSGALAVSARVPVLVVTQEAQIDPLAGERPASPQIAAA
jgi:nucleotide-binding universal stress UspA family protein